MENYLSKLNKEQYEAATCVDGPLLILAGAGSGKTNTMTHRIAYMIQDKGISPYSILAVTFTNKAAREMRERVEGLVGSCRGMWIQTFHSACLRILRSNADRLGYTNSFVVYDPVDQKALVKSIAKELHLDDKKFPPALFLGVISSAKNKGKDAEKFKSEANYSVNAKTYAEVYELYEKQMKKNNAMDFDDLILNTVKLLIKNPDVLAEYQERFKYIMVDEYQDTNMLQYKLVRLLASGHKNICVVGDDDQCIYQWRGADIRNILEFEKDFPGTKLVKLEQNYRSSGNIINAAHSVIVKNSARKDKHMRTSAADGEKIEYYRADDDKEEARWIGEKIKASMRNNPDLHYSDFAILYRNNAQSRRFEDSLSAKDIPFQVLSGMRYYDRAEVKDMIAYMRLVVNPMDDVSLLRIINTPRRGIGAKKIESLQALAKLSNCSIFEAMKSMEVGKELTDIYDSLLIEKENMSVEEIYDILLDRSGYAEALKEQGKPETDAKLENILEFKSDIQEKQAEAEKNGEAFTLENFMEGIALASDIDNHDPNQDAVAMMTLHSAKGLEFPVVFMPGMERGLFPSYRSLDKPDGVEEERRLCYVGMTRAKEKLFMSSAEMRMLYGRTDITIESQFLREIDKQYLVGMALYDRKSRTVDRYDTDRVYDDSVYVSPISIINQIKARPKKQTLAGIDVKPGDRVDHAKFGEGLVLEVDGNIIRVQFEEGAKNLAKDMAPLTKIE